MHSRVREIVDQCGDRLRILVTLNATAVLIMLELPDQADAPMLVLDPRGAEILAAFIMSARLAVPYALPDEDNLRGRSFRLKLVLGSGPFVEVRQPPTATPFAIPTHFWDKLYAELCLAIAHTRDLEWRAPARIH